MESMEDIYRKYSNYVYQYLLAASHDAEVAEEVTQETFCQAITSIHKFDGSCKITTWLCAIAKNQLLTYRRKHPKMEPLERENQSGDVISVMDEYSQGDSAEMEYLDQDSKIAIMKKIHMLKEPYREILYLRIYGGLSFKEIGEVFNKTENWARVSFYRCKEQVRKELDS